MERLQNKVAIITGGTSGMGLATAKRFVQEGAKVVVTARKQEAVDAYNQEAEANTLAVLADVTDFNATKAAIETTVSKFGKIDVLFLNAGVAKPRPMEAVDVENYNYQWDINFKGAFYTVQLALGHINEGGSIIFNTSIGNVKGMPGMSVYAATKAAVRSLVRTLAAELAPKKIRVNAISPGPIETPIFNKMDIPAEAMEDFSKQFLASIPLGRLGTSEEIASATLFLASDDASFITGAELPVDGGMAQV